MIRVVGDRVLVALSPAIERSTDSGIILVKDPELRAHTQGIVMQLGEKSGTVDLDEVMAVLDEFLDTDDPDYLNDKFLVSSIKALAPAPFDVAVGDMILFPPNCGEQFAQDGISYVILSESDVIGVLEPETEAV